MQLSKGFQEVGSLVTHLNQWSNFKEYTLISIHFKAMLFEMVLKSYLKILKLLKNL